MKLELVIFDVDGLLLDTERTWQKTWHDIGIKHGVKNLGSEVFLKCIGHTGKVVEDIILQEVTGIEEPLALLQEVREAGKIRLENELELKPGAKQLIAYLKENQIPMAIGTSTISALNEERLKKVDVFHEFCYMLCGDEVTKRKPDPEVYNRIVEQFGVDKENVVILEDSYLGVEAAYRANVSCIMVPDILPATEIQLKQTMHIAKSLYEVKDYIEQYLLSKK